MKNFRRLGIISLLLASPVTGVRGADLMYNYSQPATNWDDALPVGNGQIGAFVLGGVDEERLQLDDTTYWTGASLAPDNSTADDLFAQIRPAISGAKSPAVNDLRKELQEPDCEMVASLGELNLVFPQDHAAITHYQRSLDFQRGVVTLHYQAGNQSFTREMFGSYPDKMIVIHLACDQPGQMSCRATFNSILRDVRAADGANDSLITADGEVFLRLRARADGGTITRDGATLVISRANDVLLLLSAGGGLPVANKSPARAGGDGGRWDEKKSYAALRRRYEADYQTLFGRGDLQVDGAGDEGVSRLAYQYGRYFCLAGAHRADLPGTDDIEGKGPFADNFVFTTAVSTMLLRSDLTTNAPGKLLTVLRLLPALPPNWPHGRVSGLCARGGFLVDMEWKTGRVVSATIQSTGGTDFEVRTGNLVKRYKLKRGHSIILDAGLEKWSE